MKWLIISTLLLCTCSLAPNPEGSYNNEYEMMADTASWNKDGLENIQDKIKSAFSQSMIVKKADPLNQVQTVISGIRESPLKRYWHSYLLFYHSLFHQQVNQSESARGSINLGIGILQKNNPKNSDDLSLLALMQGFAIQFQSEANAAPLAFEAKSNLKKAISLNARNVRAYFVYASNNYYTPEIYGGKKEAEAYLLKAIQLPEQVKSSKVLPSWGREEAFELLIRFYAEKNQWDKARAIYKQAITLYPNSYTIKNWAVKLMEHT